MPLMLGMDTAGWIVICMITAIVVGALSIFYVVSQRLPRGGLLLLGVVLVMMGQSVSPEASVLPRFIGATLLFVGAIGSILGIVDLIRKRPARSRAAHPPTSRRPPSAS